MFGARYYGRGTEQHPQTSSCKDMADLHYRTLAGGKYILKAIADYKFNERKSRGNNDTK